MTALLAHKLYRILPRVYKLELQRPGQTLFQRVWRDEAGGHGLGGIELGGGAELLYADGRDGEFLAGDEGQGIETVAAHHAKPVGEVGGGDMLAQHLTH